MAKNGHKSNGHKSELSKTVRGRPRTVVETPEQLEMLVDAYFAQAIDDSLFCPTITGLCLYCGYVNRDSFYDMEKVPEFTSTVKRARSLIETVYEKRLHGANSTGAIFALKNFGWRDDQPQGPPVPVERQIIIVRCDHPQTPAETSVTVPGSRIQVERANEG